MIKDLMVIMIKKKLVKIVTNNTAASTLFLVSTTICSFLWRDAVWKATLSTINNFITPWFNLCCNCRIVVFVCAYKDDTVSSEKTAQIIDKKQIKEAYTVKHK